MHLAALWRPGGCGMLTVPPPIMGVRAHACWCYVNSYWYLATYLCMPASPSLLPQRWQWIRECEVVTTTYCAPSRGRSFGHSATPILCAKRWCIAPPPGPVIALCTEPRVQSRGRTPSSNGGCFALAWGGAAVPKQRRSAQRGPRRRT